MSRWICIMLTALCTSAAAQPVTPNGQSDVWRDEWRCLGLLGALPTKQIPGMKAYYDERPKASGEELADKLRALADSGDKDAQFTYSVLLLTGRCVPQDICAARRYRQLSHGSTRDWEKTYPIPREFEKKEAETVCS